MSFLIITIPYWIWSERKTSIANSSISKIILVAPSNLIGYWFAVCKFMLILGTKISASLTTDFSTKLNPAHGSMRAGVILLLIFAVVQSYIPTPILYTKFVSLGRLMELQWDSPIPTAPPGLPVRFNFFPFYSC